MSALLPGLAPNGRLLVIGASAEPIEAPPALLIFNSISIDGWYSGTAIDSEDTLRFTQQAGVRSTNEVFPLERAAEAYQRMMSGRARFRDVLVMSG